MQLLGLQQIVMQRNLRLLEESERHWANADAATRQRAVPGDSFNMVKKKVQAPIGASVEPSKATV